MSEDWAERQRQTNQLARLIADHVFRQKRVTPTQLYGIAKLSWITNSYEGENAAYIQSTKIPALGDIFDEDYSEISLQEVAADVASKLDRKKAEQLVISHTGFTNFYKAYRNSVATWVKKYHSRLLPMFKAARKSRSDKDRLKLVRAIANMPGIPKANYKQQLMRPEYFVTPVLFMLDEQIKFPLINGNEWVQNLLNALDVANASLEKQYKSLVSLIGTGGIRDAADLDQVRSDLPDFITTRGKQATKNLLANKETRGKELPLKDETDFKSLQKARSITHKKIHNQLTNKLKASLSHYTLLEGRNHNVMVDVIVKNYDSEKNDLLIEVKSSNESAHIRMAVGQLFDYWFNLKGEAEAHLAILVPEKPNSQQLRMLDWLQVGAMWFDDDQLKTSVKWLKRLVS